jgi:hypothetical protein
MNDRADRHRRGAPRGERAALTMLKLPNQGVELRGLEIRLGGFRSLG